MKFRICGPDDLDPLINGALRAYGTRVEDLASACAWSQEVLLSKHWLVLTAADEPAGETVMVSSVSQWFFAPQAKDHSIRFLWSHTGRIFTLMAMIRAAVSWAEAEGALEHILNFPSGINDDYIAMAKRLGFAEAQPVFIRRSYDGWRWRREQQREPGSLGGRTNPHLPGA